MVFKKLKIQDGDQIHEAVLNLSMVGLNLQEVIEFQGTKYYRESYKEEYRATSQNRRAKIKEAGGIFSAKDVISMFESQLGECTGCLGDLLMLDYHVDHIMPISKGGTNWPENLQLLCPTCNLQKSAKLPEEEEKELLTGGDVVIC